MPMKNFKKFLFLICVFVFNALPLAQATEVLSTTGPTFLKDNQITVGSRTLSLPVVKNGSWYITSFSTRDFTVNQLPNGSKTVVTELSLVVDSTVIASLTSVLLNNSVDGSGMEWGGSLCNQEDFHIYFDTFGGRYKNPGCLSVSSIGRIKLDEKTENWASQNKFKTFTSYHITQLKKYASNDFGVINAYIPLELSSSENILAWSKTLPDALLSFLAKSSFNAQLPAFPHTQ